MEENEAGETDHLVDDLTPLRGVPPNNLPALDAGDTSQTRASEVTPPLARNEEDAGEVNSLV